MTRSRSVLTTLAALLLLAGCGETAGEPAAAPSSAAATPSPTSSPTPSPTSPTSTPTPVEYVDGELGSCFIPRTAAEVRPAELRGRGMQLPGIVFAPAAGGDGTVVVLLHQSDGGGRCGWGPFGNAVAASGMTALAFDQCGYAGSDCTVVDPDDPLPQVRLALGYARARLGAERIVLVGASMGGNRAVRAVAAGADVDAWADISGPSVYDDVSLAPLAASIDVPGLVAFAADTDGPEEAALAEALAGASGATWVPAEGGHGYELLTDRDGVVLPVGQQVPDLARG